MKRGTALRVRNGRTRNNHEHVLCAVAVVGWRVTVGWQVEGPWRTLEPAGKTLMATRAALTAVPFQCATRVDLVAPRDIQERALEGHWSVVFEGIGGALEGIGGHWRPIRGH